MASSNDVLDFFSHFLIIFEYIHFHPLFAILLLFFAMSLLRYTRGSARVWWPNRFPYERLRVPLGGLCLALSFGIGVAWISTIAKAYLAISTGGAGGSANAGTIYSLFGVIVALISGIILVQLVTVRQEISTWRGEREHRDLVASRLRVGIEIISKMEEADAELRIQGMASPIYNIKRQREREALDKILPIFMSQDGPEVVNALNLLVNGDDLGTAVPEREGWNCIYRLEDIFPRTPRLKEAIALCSDLHRKITTKQAGDRVDP